MDETGKNQDTRRSDAPLLSDADPVRRAQIQMLKPLPKRFYTSVTIKAEPDNGHAILVDGRPVRTPARAVLAVPTEDAARLLAAEWEAQKDIIDPATMPVTRLANTAIDGVAKDMRAVFDDILNFAGTDLLCYRAGHPQELVARQAQLWDPVIAWAAETFGARFILVEGVIHQPQPQAAIQALAAALRVHETPLALACLHTMTTLTGSALLATAIAASRLTAQYAWSLAHLDEDWQIEHWGTDEEAVQRRQNRWREMQAAAATLDALR